MKHAYLILTHKNQKQLLRLIQALDSEESTFLVHIDAKVAIRPFIRLFENFPPMKIFFCPGRINISWGSFSMVNAILNLIRYSIQMGLRADYFHLLSGQDYPLQSIENIYHFFEENNGKSFMDYFSLPTKYWPEKGLNRINKFWALNNEMNLSYNNLDYKNQIDPVSALPHSIMPYGGSQWWSLHIDCIKYITDVCNESNPLFKFYQHTLIPDEMFFHTLLLNSPLKDTIINNNLRFVKWPSYIGSPEIITMKHCKKVLESGKLFARKFDQAHHREIMDHIDKHCCRNISSKNDYSFNKTCKWCVISTVGKKSLHRNWITGKPQFELHLIVYDDSYDMFKNDAPFVSQSVGYKYKLIYNYVINNQELLNNYDYFYLPDDDIDINTENIHRLFRYMKEYDLSIAQPAIANDYISYRHTRRYSGSVLRYTNFVEVMQPCFSTEALKKVLFTFNENNSGWGIDFHWGELLDYHRYNMAIIDDVASVHTRPIQSNHHKELNEYLLKHNLTQHIKENIL